MSLCATWLPAAALAQDCVRIDDDAERLACFDRLHGRAAARAPAPAPAPAPAQPQPAAPLPPTATMAPPGSPSHGTAAPGHEPRREGVLSRAWDTDRSSQPFELRPYRPIYILPVSITDNVNRRPASPAPGHSTGVDLPNKDIEAKFQVSARTLAWRGVFGETGDLWVAYTQSSRWQVYQGDISRPFRETNYEPEVLLNFRPDFEWLGWRASIAGVALNHQSNGRALPLSRSWNRVIGHLGLEKGNWSVVVRPWWRIPESAEQDDNPDISDHMGRADLTVRRYDERGNGLSLKLRHTLRTGEHSRGAAEFEWSFPVEGRLHGFVQVFSGYGESLIDYNIRQNRLGLGFSIAGWN